MSFNDQQTWAGVAGGTANAITLPIPDITTNADLLGVLINFIIAATNTGPVTITAGSTPPRPLLKMTPTGLTPMSGNELIAGPGAPNICSAIYDGTEYVAQSFTPVISSSTNLQTFITSGTYFPSAGKLGAFVIAIAGGGSAGCAGPVNNAGGGWAGGCAITYIPLAGIVSIPITIGLGGAQQTTATANGNPGGSTSVGGFAVATGGPGGWGPAGALPVTPGTGTVGRLLLPGNAGQLPTGGNQGGLGGGGIFGGGGSPGTIIPSGPTAVPTAGANGGGGGPGPAPGGPSSPGMPGGNGLVIILELT